MARRPRAVVAVVALLVATSLLVVADATRPLKQLPSSSSSSSSCSSEGAGGAAAARTTTVESPLGYIDTVVGTAAGQGRDGAGHHRPMMNIDMLRGIKDSGPSPGAGH